MARVLVLFAHPALHRSRANARLVAAARAVHGVTVHDLYETYPDFFICAEDEKERLLAHDVIVWHHPFYWYSCPALLKEWINIVLEHGFAYGDGGMALKGKRAMTALTTGGVAEAYGPDGFNRFTISHLLAPFEQTARLCGMTYEEPFVVHGTHQLSDPDLDAHAARYAARLAELAATSVEKEDSA